MGRIAFLLALALTACTTQLERGLSEESADEIVVALSEHGIGATKEAERGGTGFGVVVLESDVAGALSALREEGLPRTRGPSLAETFAEPSLIPTAGEERARLAAALAADLERTIESLAGAHAAHVHVGLPDPSAVPIDEQPEPRSASVLVECEAGATVDETAIRSLVVGAVPGLSGDHVSIVTTTREPRAATVTQPHTTLVRGLAASLIANLVLVACVAFVIRRSRGRST